MVPPSRRRGSSSPPEVPIEDVGVASDQLHPPKFAKAFLKEGKVKFPREGVEDVIQQPPPTPTPKAITGQPAPGVPYGTLLGEEVADRPWDFEEVQLRPKVIRRTRHVLITEIDLACCLEWKARRF